MEDFKLGPRQQAWVDSLRKNHERQTNNCLGKGNPKSYTACCLGEACLVRARRLGQKLPFKNGRIFDEEYGIKMLPKNNGKTVEYFGFKFNNGAFKASDLKPEYRKDFGPYNTNVYGSLSVLNDFGKSWKYIADLVENNPSVFFTKSL